MTQHKHTRSVPALPARTREQSAQAMTATTTLTIAAATEVSRTYTYAATAAAATLREADTLVRSLGRPLTPAEQQFYDHHRRTYLRRLALLAELASQQTSIVMQVDHALRR